MKRTLKLPTLLCAVALGTTVLAGPSAQADQITGSIGFGGYGVTINSTDLATATSFAISNPRVNHTTGAYNAVPALDTSITFNGFVFNPPVSSITPLWTFDVGTTVYSFDATTVSSTWNPTLDSWEIGGAGIAMITGYQNTVGTWNVNLSESGGSFVFDSSAGSVAAVASVHDSSSTMTLLGAGCIGMVALGRRARR